MAQRTSVGSVPRGWVPIVFVAAALVLLQQAKLNQWSADEALAKGKAMGLEVDGGLRTLVENYLREQSGSA